MIKHLSKLFKIFILFILTFTTISVATPFTEAIPNGHGAIPATYPKVGGTMVVLIGANGNIYYQFVNPSTQFEGFQMNGQPASFRGKPFQLGPTQALNCGPTPCTTYFGGSIVEGYVRLTVRDADACPGNFDYQDVFFELNGFRISSFSDLTFQNAERTNRAGTISRGFENCFRNQRSNETSTSWFDLGAVPGVLNDIFTNESTTPKVFDDDGGGRGDNKWFFKDGNDATGTPEVAPGITVTKSADKASYTTVGEAINYSFLVSNVGSVTLNSVVLTDSFIAGAVSCPKTTLVSGENMTCTGQHTITQANIDNDLVFVNTADVTASPTEGTIGSVSGTLSISGPPAAPSLTIVKVASKTTNAVLGDVITYTYTITNNGNITMDNIFVADTHNGSGTLTTVTNDTITVNSNGLSVDTSVNGLIDSLAPGDTATLTSTYTITQTDVDNGINVTNTAKAIGTPKRGTATPPTASESVTLVPPNPLFTVQKSTSSVIPTGTGQTLDYTFTVVNTGNVSLDTVAVSDGKCNGIIALDSETGSIANVLEVGETQEYSCLSIPVTQVEIDVGTVDNTVTVDATTPSGVAVASVSDTLNIPITQTPVLTVSKTADDVTDVVVGQTITYTYEVNNTGNVGIDNITLADVHSGTGIAPVPVGGVTTLLPGTSTTYTATYVVTQADIDADVNIDNTVTVTGVARGAVALTPVTANESVDVVNPNPKITVAKIASTPTVANGIDASITDAGDTITYTITANNTGNMTLLDVSILDPIVPSLTACTYDGNGSVFVNDTTQSIPVGEGVTCTADYVLTDADLNNGNRDNTAGAVAKDATGTGVSDTATISSPINQTASLIVVKRGDASAVNNPALAGDVISYTFDVNNTSSVTLTNVIVTDNGLGVAPFNKVVTCPGNTGTLNEIATMAAHTSVQCTGAYALTQDDLNGVNAPTITNTGGNLEILNEVNITATPPAGSGLTPPTGTASSSVDLNASAAISLGKTASSVMDDDGDTRDTAGDTITYTYTVKNEGTTTLTNVTITEDSTSFTGTGTLPLATVSVGDATSLNPGDTVVFTATYTITQADIDAGTVNNTAKATGTPPGSMTPPDAVSSVVTPLLKQPSFNMVKTVDQTNISAPTTLTYSFEFTNNGNETLKDLTLTDANIDAGTLTGCPIAELNVSDTVVCTATKVISQADIDAGVDIVNTAIPTAKDADNNAVAEDEDGDATTPNTNTDNTATTTISQTPMLTMTKTASDTTDVVVGDTITYTYEVNNTGNISIDAVSVSDNHSGTGILTAITPASVDLAPMTGQIFTATYVVTQDDIDAGADIINTATVTGTLKGGTLTDINASETVDLIDRISAFTMSKSSTATDAQVGDSLPYTFTVVNRGNVTLTAPSITDVKCLATPTLASESLTADTRLEVGETQTYTCMSIAVTQTEVDAGVVLNTASITATPPTGATPPSPQDANTTVPVNQTPAYTFAKATASVPTQAGDTLVYTFEVNNTGNVSLNTIVIADSKCDASGVSLDTESMTADMILEVGETQVYKCTSLPILQSEVDAGEVNNTASITVDVPPSATPPAPQNSSMSTPVVPTPALSMIKTASADTNLAVGEEITYSYEVNNTGNITLDDVTVTDNHLGSGTLTAIVPASVTLVPAQVQVFTAKYTITQADVDAGVDVNNTATVTANPKGGTLTDVNATESVDVADPIPALSITKVADKKNNVKVGDTITYTYTVENTGNIGIDDVNVSDVHVADGNLSAITLTSASNDLAPGDKAEFVATYVVTQGDIDLGKDINNTATGNGTAKLGTLAPIDVNESVDLEDIAPEILVAKVASTPTVVNGVENNITDADDNITYTITLENTGNVSLQNVVASDSITTIDSCGLTSNGDVFVNDGTGTLDVGERVLCTAVYVLTTADLDAGSRSNTASVSAEDRHGTTATDTTTVSSAVTQTASIVMVKKANNSAVQNPASAGDIISYIFEVRNTSNVTLTNVVVTDNALGVAPFNMAVDCSGTPNVISSMAAHSTAQCTATYALTQADIDGTNAPTITNTAGVIEVTNDANVTGTPPLGSGLTPPTAAASALAEANVSASLSMTKTAGNIVDTNADGVDSAGDTITYTYTVKNEGTTTLANVVVEENATNFTGTGTLPLPTVSSGNATSLAPNDTVVFTATYILTQGDIDAAGLSNTASVKGEPSPPNGMLPPTASSSIAVVITQKPSFNMVKVVTPTNITGPTVLDYIFTFTNTGNVTLKDINLTDTNIDAGSLNGCPIATLNVGTVVTCSATRTITQDMIDTGVDIVNIATANAKDPLGQTANEDNDNNQSTANDLTDNTATTTITQTPKLSIIKTADKTTNITVGETITYSYEVNNTGNITIDTINVVDVHSGLGVLSAMNQTDITLAPNQGTVFKTTYVVTQDDIDSGADISNSATVDGDAKGGTLDAVEDNETVSVAPAVAQIGLVKRLVPQVTPYALGDTMHYVFDVNNTGNVTLYGVNISDTNATVSGSPITLAPGQVDSSTFTAIHVVTQNDINRGSVHNQAQVKSQDLQGNDIEDKSDDNAFDENDPTITPIVSMPGISITKKGTFDSNSSVQLGDTISYAFNITNTGNVTRFNVKVEDTNATVTGNPITLAPGESNTTAFTAIHIVTQDDIDANKVVNQAVVLAKEPNGNDINASSDDPNTVASNDPTVTQLPIVSPMAATDEANGTIGQPSTVDILANDNGGTFAIDPSSVKIVAPDGSLVTELVVAGEGVWRVNPDGTITFTPNADFSGDPTPIKYRVDDIQGNPVTTDGEIKIDYPPVAIDDIVSSLLVEPVIIKILDNDKNTSTPLDPESVSLVPPANATNIVRDAEGDIIEFTVNEGVWSVDELTGEVTFTPANSFTGGDLAAIAYTVQETDGKLVSNEASIKVSYATHILKAVNDGTITIKHYGANVIDVLKNDEFTGDVTIKILKQPKHGTVEVAIGSDGRPVIIYTPDPDSNYVPDSFRYSITDVNGQVSEAEVLLDVQCVTSQKSDGGDTYGRLSIFIMMFMTIMIGLYLTRREEKSRGEV